MVVVQLAQAGGQLAASRSRTGDHDQRFLGFDVGVGPVTVAADDPLRVGRVALGRAVSIHGDPAPLELVLELDGAGLFVEPRDHHAAQFDPPIAQVVDQLHRVRVVGDAEVRPHLLAFDGPGMDAQQDLGLVLQLRQQTHFDVGIEARQHAGCVVVKQQLAAELQVQFVVEAAYAFQDGRRLFFQVLAVVKADSVHHRWPLTPLGRRQPRMLPSLRLGSEFSESACVPWTAQDSIVAAFRRSRQGAIHAGLLDTVLAGKKTQNRLTQLCERSCRTVLSAGKGVRPRQNTLKFRALWGANLRGAMIADPGSHRPGPSG